MPRRDEPPSASLLLHSYQNWCCFHPPNSNDEQAGKIRNLIFSITPPGIGLVGGFSHGPNIRSATEESHQTVLPMPQSADQFILPDLYAVLPFQGGQNPFFDLIGKESRDWVNSYDILPQHRPAGSTTGELLASYCYPHAPSDVFRVCADFLNILITLDEVSDVQDSNEVRETIHLFVRALRDDPDCDDGSPLAKMLIRYAIGDHFMTLTSHESLQN